MVKVLNLNQARKKKSKAEAKKMAETNRMKFGRTRAQKAAEVAEQVRRDTLLDGAKRADE